VAWAVRYFVEDDGSVPAADFEDALPPALGAKLARWVQAVASSGFTLGGGMFEICHDFPNLFEVRAKVGKQLGREFCTVDGDKLVLLGGIVKAIDEATPRAALVAASERLARYKVSRRSR
jgi:hypothetical protein